MTTTPLPDAEGAPSGIGTAKPEFTHSSRGGATESGSMPMLSAHQFGIQPNWTADPPAQATSADTKAP